MKIFISYGHGDYPELVDLLFDTLKNAGHEPWKDDRFENGSGINPGEDFTEEIFRVILEYDFVVAFVSKKTMESKFCRDERQYAYNHKDKHFIQIRMDNVDITLGNSRSYIDMSDVIGSNGQIVHRVFEEKMKALFAAFRDPASFAEGGFTPWSKFDTHLKVPGAVKYHDFIASLDGSDFVGRQWLLEKCKSWAMDSSIPCRLFVILGEAGTGKTAFIRHLAKDQELVRSVHICVYDKPSTRTARDTLKDLAYTLAKTNDRYFNFLKNESLENLQNIAIDGLFEFLFITPLKSEAEKYLLVIDALDEMEETSGLKPLMQLFRQYAQKLNPNISFLVTGRPDAYITDELKMVTPGKPLESIILDKSASSKDLQCFISHKLNQLGCYNQDLADKLLDACDGNFEYLSLLFREAQEEGLSVFEATTIPRGLNERYAQYLDRRMTIAGCSCLSDEQHILLSVLCAAYEPLPSSVLAALTGLRDFKVTNELKLFGSLIRRINTGDKEPRICLFAKSFRDFLLSRSFEKYFADHQLGTELLAQYLIKKCPSEKALQKHPYLDQYGFVHLLHYASEEPEAVTEYCKDLALAGVDIAQRIAGALHLGETAIVHNYWELREEIGQHNAVISYLKGTRSAEALTELVSLLRQENEIAFSLMLEADMLLWDPTPEAFRQAEEYYQQVLMLCKQTHTADPSFENLRRVAIAYNRLGDLCKKKLSHEGNAQAERWYQEKLDLVEKYYHDNPSYESRRDLAITYTCLGDLAKRERTPEGSARAEEWYQKALPMKEQNYQDNPCYESRRDLSISYTDLGDLSERKQTRSGDAQAEQWYQKSLEMQKQNYQDNPCYESRRGLSALYSRLGDLIRKKQDKDRDAQAEQWYLKMLTVSEENYHADPCYDSRRSLATAYVRLGDIARRKHSPDGDSQAEQWYLKMLTMNEQNYRSNPCGQSQRQLAIVYDRLESIAQRKGTPEGNQEATRWREKYTALDFHW